MKRWVRRVVIFILVLFWLGIMLVPTFAFVLARNGQIQVGDSNHRHWRVFLLQEAQAEGLGLERARTVAVPDNAPVTARCLKTTINYWMWSGSGEDVTFCRCLDSLTGSTLALSPPACSLP
ncbi:MAG: hypothetical protein R6X18_16390 [Chloroflexota bacterium]|jgi:hypothetical protein